MRTDSGVQAMVQTPQSSAQADTPRGAFIPSDQETGAPMQIRSFSWTPTPTEALWGHTLPRAVVISGRGGPELCRAWNSKGPETIQPLYPVGPEQRPGDSLMSQLRATQMLHILTVHKIKHTRAESRCCSVMSSLPGSPGSRLFSPY